MGLDDGDDAGILSLTFTIEIAFLSRVARYWYLDDAICVDSVTMRARRRI